MLLCCLCIFLLCLISKGTYPWWPNKIGSIMKLKCGACPILVFVASSKVGSSLSNHCTCLSFNLIPSLFVYQLFWLTIASHTFWKIVIYACPNWFVCSQMANSHLFLPSFRNCFTRRWRESQYAHLVFNGKQRPTISQFTELGGFICSHEYVVRREIFSSMFSQFQLVIFDLMNFLKLVFYTEFHFTPIDHNRHASHGPGSFAEAPVVLQHVAHWIVEVRRSEVCEPFRWKYQIVDVPPDCSWTTNATNEDSIWVVSQSK